MKPIMEAIAQDFVCNQYDENIPVSYGSDRWDLYFWCNPFNGAADTSERDFSYFTLTLTSVRRWRNEEKSVNRCWSSYAHAFRSIPISM